MESINSSFPNRIIRPAELAIFLGVSTETIRLWRKGKIKGIDNFPQPILIGARAIGWKESDINAFIENRASIRNGLLGKS